MKSKEKHHVFKRTKVHVKMASLIMTLNVEHGWNSTNLLLKQAEEKQARK